MDEQLEQELLAKYPKILGKPISHGGLSVGNGWYTLLDTLLASIQGHIQASRESRARYLRVKRKVDQAVKCNGLEAYAKKLYGDYQEPLKSDRIAAFLENPYADLSLWSDIAVPQVHALQIKEKFGTLRFYYTGGDPVIQGMITLAENMSGTICAICGSPGKMQYKGWIACRCDKHAKQ